MHLLAMHFLWQSRAGVSGEQPFLNAYRVTVKGEYEWNDRSGLIRGHVRHRQLFSRPAER